MEINADFSRRVVIHTDDLEWQESPMPGVDRRMLDRMGGEVARATSIVRYAPNSHFSPHVHHGGEEFFVLDGVFQDEHGDYPAGSYLRNPPTSSHTPGSEAGCVIFVKLWQFDPADRQFVNLNYEDGHLKPGPGDGRSTIELFRDGHEHVRILSLALGAEQVIDDEGGAELFVLSGTIEEQGEQLGKHAWLRLPIGRTTTIRAGDSGAKLWLKTGHLHYVSAPPVPG